MAQEENFLARWSRLKRERAGEPADAATPAAPAAAREARAEEPAPLPPVEELTPESDFSAFMNPKVADALRRAALKKLFRHPQIDVPDPYEPFVGDWTGGEPIPQDMLKSLYQARNTVLRESAPESAEERADAPPEARESEEPAPQNRESGNREADRTDDAGRQDA
ncbi:MAG: DUF3306 domain-containing protein [Betaproteobacteria bacterium]|nr:DUF3306 domain-containing protein [Betaproteobacteria bacterium]